MKCGCGGVSYLSPTDYTAEANSAHMSCEHCGNSIHFGPAVAALRNREDPALGDVSAFAWYHTSTSPDWPSLDYAKRFAEELKWVDRNFGPSRESYLAEQTSKALHLGTYETAIENMLRRMKDQGDGGSQFYLYRVALRDGPLRINEGYRDENHEIAADVSMSDLANDRLDIVRYLNVHEAMGVLSIAVRRDVITALQTIPLPLKPPAAAGNAELFRDEIQAVARATSNLVDAQAAAAAIEPRRLRAMQLGIKQDPTGSAEAVGRAQRVVYDSWHRLEDRMGEFLLPNVSETIRDDFNYAMAHWRDDNSTAGVVEFVRRYEAMSALLENPDDIIAALAARPWRAVAAA